MFIIQDTQSLNKLCFSDLKLIPHTERGYAVTVSAEVPVGIICMLLEDYEPSRLEKFFAILAEDWESNPSFENYSSTFTIKATADKLGHVVLRYEMGSEKTDGWCFSSFITLEQGSLVELASKAASFFGPPPETMSYHVVSTGT